MTDKSQAVALYFENKEKSKAPIINFSSDFKRMLAELGVFALFFMFIEFISSIGLKYIMNIQYVLMSLLIIGALFFVINFFKNWKVRFTLYCIIIVFFMVMTMLNTVYVVNKHDSVSVSMAIEAIVGLEFIQSKSSAAYSPTNIYGVFGFIAIICVALSFIAAMFCFCFRNNRKSTTLYPRLAIGIITACIIGLPVFSCFYDAYGNVIYEKYYSMVNIGITNYVVQDFNCLLYREIVEKNKTFYTEPEEINVSTPTEYFGMFEGKNVIQIMLEEEESFLISPEHTPNLYYLMNNGVNFTNFYSAYSYLSTYDAEFKGLTSAMGYTANNYYLGYSNNSYKNSVPAVLSNYGYKTIGMHNYRESFFNRDKIWANIGFEETYFIEDMDAYKERYPEFTDWYDSFPNVDFPPDSVMFETMTDYYAPTNLTQPFYTYILTVGSHQPYDEHRPTLQKYYDIIAQDPKYDNYPDIYITNLVTVMDTDVGIGYMLDHLKANNMLDDTLIVIYTDHHSYKNEKEFEGYREFCETPYDIFRVPCMIYNPALTAQQSDILCSHYDIVPTIFDLCGVKYNTDYYYGQSLLSSNRDDRPIIFGPYKWIDSKMYAQNFDYVLTDKNFAMPQDAYEETSKFVWNTVKKFNYFIYKDYFKNHQTFIK